MLFLMIHWLYCIGRNDNLFIVIRNVDRLWNKWQTLHPNVTQYRGYWKPVRATNQSQKVSVDDKLAPYNVPVSRLLNVASNCYAYEDTFHTLQNMDRNCDYSWSWLKWLCEKNMYFEKKPSTDHIIVRPLQAYPAPKQEELALKMESEPVALHDDINDVELQEFHHEISHSRSRK